MRGWLGVVLLLLPLPVVAGDDDWRRQSYSQSKHLPDLHHVVDVKLADGMQPPAGFQLQDGRLACGTCHGLEKMERQRYDQVDKLAATFLRGGPYRPLQGFCYNCHREKQHERTNIHLLLDQQGQIKKQNCLYCHEELHERRSQPLPPEQLKLRLPTDKLCLGCHLKTPHLNAIEHQDAKPKPEMKQHMADQARRQGIILPLSAEGHVTCVSCHSPHPDGVMDVNNPAGAQVSGDMEKGVVYAEHSWNEVFRADKAERLEWLDWQGGVRQQLNYRRLQNEVLLRLPALDGSLCLACHRFER